jgi:hypothetical protein
MAKPKKVTRADGSVCYRIVFDAGRDPETGKRRQLTRTFDRLKEANAELARVTHERGKGTYVAPSKLTLNALLDGWLESATFEKEEATGATTHTRYARPVSAWGSGWRSPSPTRTSRPCATG